MVEYLESPYRLVFEPLSWQERGLAQTASGYGGKMASSHVAVLPDGRKRRVYVTQWSNAGSAWIQLGKRRLVLRDCDRIE